MLILLDTPQYYNKNSLYIKGKTGHLNGPPDQFF